MTPANLKAWRAACQLTQRQAAEALDIALSYYKNLEGGFKPINRRTSLACWAILNGAGECDK